MIIGIAVGICSGKTTVARILATSISARIISLDNYFKDPSTFPTILGHPDYGRKEAIDWEKAIKHIDAQKGNVIIEGFLILTH